MANDQAFHTDLGDLESEQLYLEVTVHDGSLPGTLVSFPGSEYPAETAIGQTSRGRMVSRRYGR